MRAYPQDAPTSDYVPSRKAPHPHPRIPGRRTFFRYPHSRKSRISAAIRDLYPLPFVFNCWTIRIPALRRAGARLRSGRRVGSEGRAGSTHMSFTRCRLCSNKKAGSSEPAVVVFVARDLQSEDPGGAQSNPTWGIFLALSPVQKKQPAGYEFWPLLRATSARCRRECWPVIALLHEALHLPRRRAPFAKKRGSSIRPTTRLAASTRARWTTGRT